LFELSTLGELDLALARRLTPRLTTATGVAPVRRLVFSELSSGNQLRLDVVAAIAARDVVLGNTPPLDG